MRTIKIMLLICLLYGICLYAGDKPVILLAFEETRFKTALIEEMKDLLEADGFSVETLDHSDGALDNIDTNLYEIIFITNSGVNSKVRPWISQWLSQIDPDVRVLLHTTQRTNWTVEASVDTVTSASARRNVKTFAKEYTEKIKEIASRNND